MELHVVSTEGIPDGCILSVRAGATRRQAPVSADRPFRFPTTLAEAQPFKVDVLEPVASARLIMRPGEEHRQDCQYRIPMEPPTASATNPAGKAEGGDTAGKGGVDMSVTIAVRATEEALKEEALKAAAKEGADGAGSRPNSSSRKGGRDGTGSSSSSRLGQASAAREYLDQHNLVEFTQLLVQSVIKEQPDRPYAFMAKQFFFPEPQPRPTGESAAQPEQNLNLNVPIKESADDEGPAAAHSGEAGQGEAGEDVTSPTAAAGATVAPTAAGATIGGATVEAADVVHKAI